MGAFVTTALVGAYPTDFRVASHTAGGVRLAGIITGPAPSEAQARAIRTPYQLHHGDQDTVVPIAQDQRLDSVLQASGVAHEFHVYPGVDHTEVATSPAVLARIRTWYVGPSGAVESVSSTALGSEAARSWDAQHWTTSST